MNHRIFRVEATCTFKEIYFMEASSEEEARSFLGSVDWASSVWQGTIGDVTSIVTEADVLEEAGADREVSAVISYVRDGKEGYRILKDENLNTKNGV